MEHANTLNHLLQVEAAAAAMVKDAQEEADRRIREGEEKNRISYEERYKTEIKMQEASLQENNDNVKKQYKDTLDKYRSEISGVNVNKEKFYALLHEYLENE